GFLSGLSGCILGTTSFTLRLSCVASSKEDLKVSTFQLSNTSSTLSHGTRIGLLNEYVSLVSSWYSMQGGGSTKLGFIVRRGVDKKNQCSLGICVGNLLVEIDNPRFDWEADKVPNNRPNPKEHRHIFPIMLQKRE